jgi:hypothetical protein
MFNPFKPNPQIAELLQRTAQLEADLIRLRLAGDIQRDTTDAQSGELADVCVDLTNKVSSLTSRVNRAELATRGLGECSKCFRAIPLGSLNGTVCFSCEKAA